MAVLWAVAHFRPYLAGRSFALVTDCSALTWLFRSRDLDPKLYRWSLRLAEFDMMRWRAVSSHQLPDALSRLPRPGPAADPIDDSFPDDATSGELGDYVGPQGPVLEGVLLKDLEPLKEGMVDPGGARERRVGVTINTANPRLPKNTPETAPAKVTFPRCALAAWSHCRQRTPDVPEHYHNTNDRGGRSERRADVDAIVPRQVRRARGGGARGGEAINAGAHAVGTTEAAP